MRLPDRADVAIHAHAVSDDVVEVVCTHPDGAMQLQPYATPLRTTSWACIRAHLLTHLAETDTTAGATTGAFGPEIHATVPAALAAGQPARPQPIRHLGLDEPGWFLYAVITGPAALDSALPRRASTALPPLPRHS